MNAAEIKQRLSAQAEAVCRHLLPNGKRTGHEWCAGSVGGEPGGSLKVHLDGPRAGLWADFADGSQKGDLISLWMATRVMAYGPALDEIRQWLGVPINSDDAFHRAKSAKPFRRPDVSGYSALVSGGVAFDYLVRVRKLDPDTLRKYRVAQTSTQQHGPTIVFPCFAPSESKAPDMVKFLAVERGEGGKKMVWSSADSRDHLFGWQSIAADAREVAITEGEIDALTVAGWGFPALSIPRGVKSFDWLEHDFDALERFERILICTDQDTPGHECAETIAARLGRERCFRVCLPSEYKDANEAQMSGMFCGADFIGASTQARTLDPSQLRHAADYRDAVADQFWPRDPRTNGSEPPIPLPWKCRPGELSIWTGFSGHGKSLLLSQFALHDVWQDERTCIASFEIPAPKTLATLVRMALGRMPKNREDTDRAIDWLDGKVWLLDHRGPLHWQKFLPILEYAAKRYGCTRFIVDSLLLCGIGEDDYSGQKEMVGALLALAASTSSHVHLVAHSRKKEDEGRAPGKLDVRGSGSITDMAHNGFTVWRNKAKVEEVTRARESGRPEQIARADAIMDAQLQMWKNREGGDEPFCSLWLHPQGMTFRSNRDTRHTVYVQ